MCFLAKHFAINKTTLNVNFWIQSCRVGGFENRSRESNFEIQQHVL